MTIRSTSHGLDLIRLRQEDAAPAGIAPAGLRTQTD
jgi:hypothetical protein